MFLKYIKKETTLVPISSPNIIEGLSFKLCLDFVKYLKQNRLCLSNITLGFYDIIKRKHTYQKFSNESDLIKIFNQKYINKAANCKTGNIVSIKSFDATSDIYNFNTAYRVIDVSESYQLIPLSSYDTQRNSNRKPFKDRQINLIKITISEYLKFFSEINNIYESGIYSPCYAEPGWSENTSWFVFLKDSLNNISKDYLFPHVNNLGISSKNNSSIDNTQFNTVNQQNIKPPNEPIITNIKFTSFNIAKIFANINGGSSYNSNNKLIFKIYGVKNNLAYLIKKTKNVLVDNDVNINDEDLEIENINVGIYSEFRISTVDEWGNESPLSNNVVLLIPNWFGITVDTTKAGVSATNQFQFTGALGAYDVDALQNDVIVATYSDLLDE